jgi:hypothetical protein
LQTNASGEVREPQQTKIEKQTITRKRINEADHKHSMKDECGRCKTNDFAAPKGTSLLMFMAMLLSRTFSAISASCCERPQQLRRLSAPSARPLPGPSPHAHGSSARCSARHLATPRRARHSVASPRAPRRGSSRASCSWPAAPHASSGSRTP